LDRETYRLILIIKYRSILYSHKNRKRNSIESNRVKVLLVENDQQKASGLAEELKHSNYNIVRVFNTEVPLLKMVEDFVPEILIIDIEYPETSVIDSLNQITQRYPTPIVMFSETEDTNLINLLVKSGVTAYVAGEVDLKRIKSILDTAIARFNEYHALKNELQQTKSKLNNQRTIEQAKHLLMRTKNYSEDEAYHSMRKLAMDNGQKIEEVAKNMLSLASLMEPNK